MTEKDILYYTPIPYITYKHYRGFTLTDDLNSHEYVTLKYGDELVAVLNSLISLADKTGSIVCYTDSQAQYEHFAYNADGEGLERGALIDAIAFAQRENGTQFRFTDKEQFMLRTKWKKYLMNYEDTILFNSDFYTAPILELQTLAADLSIQKRKGKYKYVRNSR